MNPSQPNRLNDRLALLQQQKRAGFVPFIMAGDPSLDYCRDLLHGLPAAGADIIELGMPFSDPVADGPTIQAAGLRALAANTKLDDIFALVSDFRRTDHATPIILMGYYNPLYHRGVDRFMQQTAAAGVDGLIIVDVPVEEMKPLQNAANAHLVHIIRLIAPTSLNGRLEKIADQASGFLYYISVAGITGSQSASMESLQLALKLIRAKTTLPLAVGFGIKSPDDVARVAMDADLVVVGSSIVAQMAAGKSASEVLDFCRKLAAGIKPRQ